MGNVEVTDMAPVRSDERKELNISRKVNYKQYCRHVKREYAETCLMDLPWSIRDSISLYERMDVSFHTLTELPVELPLRLPHLNFLNLSYNKLAALPESFSLLFHLKTLLINHNLIQHLPKSFIHLVKLEKLDISHNLLRELPEDIGNMESLKKINVSNNKLKTLPVSLGTSESVSTILATNNRLTFPPQKLCNEGPEVILRFLKRNASNGVIASSRLVANVFPRVRGNQVASAVVNPHSAQAQYIQTQTHTTNTPSRIKTPLLPPLDSSRLDALDLRDRIVGLIYGAAIGDAIGVATQFMAKDECEFHYDRDDLQYRDIIRDAHRVRWRQGDWTCYFDHFALVLDGVIQWAGVVDELDFAKRLHSWSSSGFPELGDSHGYTYCNTIVKVLNDEKYLDSPHLTAQGLIDNLKQTEGDGSDVDEDNLDQFADNGALVRAAVLGIPLFHDLSEVTQNTIRICRATHADQRCLALSVWLASMVALLLQGVHNMSKSSGVEDLITAANNEARNVLKDESHIKEFDEYIQVKDFDSVQVNQPGRVVYVYKPIASTVAALRQELDYKSSISDLVMRGGDSCANATVTGAILGCKAGFSALPKNWVQDLRERQTDWLNIKINSLLDMMGIP